METQLKSRLQERIRQAIQDSHLKQAAVLLPLFTMDGAYHVLFIMRSRKVEHHKGEISFPGGICEEFDDGFERTALRETHEEIGIRPEDVRVRALRAGPQSACTTLLTAQPFDRIGERMGFPLA